MLGNNCEKTVLISPTYNKWTQIDDQNVSMASSSVKVMEKPNQELLQQQQQALRCPRCDSSNTKFCYYNNYSLSQPRHFCKACKRYWTRGGTLRNVPVGGGCRKNKRVKRPITTSSSSTIDLVSSVSTTTNVSPSSSSTPSTNSQPSSTTSNQINPLFYGLPGSGGNSSDVMNLQFPRFNSRVYDLQPHMNALGLGFSSGVLSSEVSDNIGYRNGGFSSSNSNNNNTSFVSSYNSIFGASSTSMPSNPVMASLLSSTLLQQKFLNKGDPGSNAFHQGILMEEVNHGSEREMVALKDVKVEGQNRLEWNNNNGGACQNQIEHMGLLSDPSLYWNNTAATTGLGGAWSDQPNNIGPSSVTPLI